VKALLLAGRLRVHNAEVVPDQDLPGHRRFHTGDCFGNRLEFPAVVSSS
jgi:hypothetical protein